jgi:hypothetical protein
MKLSKVFAVSLLAIAAPAFAQTSQPLSRADVKAQLIQVEMAGYSPAGVDDTTYPVDIQTAEAKVANKNEVAAASVGGIADGSRAK